MSDGVFLQCQSLDLFSSQGQVTTQGDNNTQPTDYIIKRPRPSSPAKKRNVSPAARTRSNSPSRSRSNSARQTPSLNSPNKRSPRQRDPALIKRRTINHS